MMLIIIINYYNRHFSSPDINTLFINYLQISYEAIIMIANRRGQNLEDTSH